MSYKYNPFTGKLDYYEKPAAVGSGEANTASNLGVGEGVYSSKSGVDLLFKSIAAASAAITIASNATSILIDISEANIVHDNLSGAGTTTHADLDIHVGDGTLHFTEGSIDHTAIANIGSNSHNDIDNHISDATLHFTEGSIDHTAITNIGTNSHSDIDDHISDADKHREINDSGTASTDLWSADKIGSEIVANVPILNPRVVFKEEFTGNGVLTTFQLDGTLLNATFTNGTWAAASILNTYPSHITAATKIAIYDSANIFTRNRISVSSISPTGLVTLSHAPLAVNFEIYYWYELQDADIIDDYYREDFIASMEATTQVIASGVPADTTNFNGVLSVADTTVQAALDTIDDHTHLDTDIELDQLGSPTYTNLREFNNNTQSSSIIEGILISDSGSGQIDVSSGSAYLKTTDSDIGSLVSLDYAGTTNYTIPDETYSYIYLDYNGGTPIIGDTANVFAMDLHTQIPIGTVYRSGSDLHISPIPANYADIQMRSAFRLFELYGRKRSSGMVTSEVGTRNLDVTAGVLYFAQHRLTTAAIDTSAAGTFTYWYNDGAWQSNTSQTTIDNTQYNDYGTGLATLSNNKFGVHWVYMCNGGDLHVVYGIGDYTSTEVFEVAIPSSLPPMIATTGIFIAKIIIEKSSATIDSILYPWTTAISSSGVTRHNDLASLEGLGPEYVHLNALEYAAMGDVSKVGTPVDDQVGVWTGDGTLEGDVDLTFDGSNLSVGGNIVVGGTVDGIDIATDVAANTLKVTNVSTALSTGTVTATTYGITSDGGVDDVVLPEATTTTAGLLGAAKWNEIEDKVDRADWDQSGFYDRSDSTIAFTDATRTFSVQPVVTNFRYCVAGVNYTSTGATLVISNANGSHFIYFDGAVLTESVNPTDTQIDVIIRTKCLVSIIIYNTVQAEGIYVGEERHGALMSSSTHSYLHFLDGLRYSYGLGLNTMSVDGSGITADAQFGIDSGGVSDEDIYDVLDAVLSTTGTPIYYMVGSGAVWYRHVEAGFNARTFDGTSSTGLAYNQYTGGAWQLTEVANNKFVLYHLFATTEKDKPLVSIMGQNTYDKKKDARTGALVEVKSLVLDYALFPEVRPIATIIYQTNTGYANTVNAKIVSTDEGDEYIDWRSENISRVAISTTDHSSLTGLSSDDHTQYLLADGTRELSADWDAGSFKITTTDLEVTNAIAGSITGNSATVTVANEASDTTCFPTFVTASTGDLAPKTSTGWGLSSAHAYTGTGSATSGLPRMFLGTNTPSGDDSALLICRALAGTDLFSHAVRDESTFTSLNTGAYCSFDSIPVMSGTLAYNHIAAFQCRHSYIGSGGLTDSVGFSYYINNTGTITSASAIRIYDYAGAGSVTNFYGLKMEAVTKPTNHWVIYSSGTSESYHAGKFGVGTSSPISLLSVQGDTAAPTVFQDGSAGQFNISSLGLVNTVTKITFSTPNYSGGPCAGIGVKWEGAGSSMLFGTTNTYAGISNTALTISPTGLVSVPTGLVLGEDLAGGTPNIAGYLKLFSAGDNAYYSTFTAGTQTANSAYVLPTAPPTVDGMTLTSTISGTMSWSTTSIDDLTDGSTSGGTQNVFLGTNAGPLGDYNTGVGYGALDVVNATGTYNSALGNYALSGVTTGDYNVGIGSNAGLTIAEGSANIAIGKGSVGLGSTTSAFANNIAIGTDSMGGAGAKSGTDNVGIGQSTLSALTTGINNVGLGYNSLSAITTGDYNIAIGYNSGLSIDEGDTNVAIGRNSISAGSVTTAFISNIAIGYTSMGGTGAKSGIQNIGIGESTLQSLTSGSGNVALGWRAGFDIESCSYNVVIGYNAVNNAGSTTSTFNYNLALGYLSMGGAGVKSGSSNTGLGATTLFSITSGGLNAGIGTNALYSATSGDRNSAMGANALYSTSTGSYNLGIGSAAGYNVTTGDYNTALGYQAGYHLLSGDSNIAIGKDSINGGNTTSAFANNIAIGTDSMGGAGAKSGYGNVGIGRLSLSDLTTGNENLSIGTNSLHSLTTGDTNTAVGSEALYGITTGSNNLGFGSVAGYSITTGSDNIAMGRTSMGSTGAKTGSYNLGMGFDTLKLLTTGNDNVAIGRLSLSSLTTGTSNVGIGRSSFSEITTGDSNIGIGYVAGDEITTGDYNIAFGYLSLSAAETSSSSNICLGTSAGQSMSGICSNNTFIGTAAGGPSASGTKTACVYLGYNAGNNAAFVDTDDELVIANSATATPLIYGEFPNTSLTFNADDVIITGTLTSKLQILAKTAAYPVTSANSRTLFTNEGAGGAVVFTLPTAVAGLTYTFVVQAAQYLRITAAASDTIRNAASVSSAAGYIRANTIGNSVTITAINATEWVVTSVIGTWTIDA